MKWFDIKDFEVLKKTSSFGNVLYRCDTCQDTGWDDSSCPFVTYECRNCQRPYKDIDSEWDVNFFIG